MPDESSTSEQAATDRPGDPTLAWSASTVANDTVADAADGESLELDLAGQELAEADGGSPAPLPDDEPTAPSSERAIELEGEHWRERAIVWRERAMAAELVAKMLQRNLDDLRANVEDLRLKVEAAAAADAQRTAAIESSQTPWRRFASDLYAKYLG
jgi:hypothetical protein